VVLVQVLDKIIHILEITRLAAFPQTHGHLILGLVVVGRHAWVVAVPVVWRRRHGAICVFRDVAKVVHGGSGHVV
jgi:hypothetical protein